MQDDGLTPAARIKYQKFSNSRLIHDMNEMRGHLQVRTTVEVESGAQHVGLSDSRKIPCAARIAATIVKSNFGLCHS